MNVNRIENNELRNFVDKNPEADFRNIVDFCIQKFDDAIAILSSNESQKLQNTLNNNNLREKFSKLGTIMEPHVKQTSNIRNYQKLKDTAQEKTREFIREIDEIGNNHSIDFINSLKNIVHNEFENLKMIKPNSRIDLDLIYSDSDRKMNSQKDTKDSDDRIIVANVNSRVTEAKKTIYNQFAELSKKDIQMYGIVYEPGRGVSQNRNLINGIKNNVEQLAITFNSTNQFFQSDITDALRKNNTGILDEIKSIVRDCRNIINEAVYQISKEMKEEELRQDNKRKMDIKEKMAEEDRQFEARKEEQRKEEKQYQERTKTIKAEKEDNVKIDNISEKQELEDTGFKYDKNNIRKKF